VGHLITLQQGTALGVFTTVEAFQALQDGAAEQLAHFTQLEPFTNYVAFFWSVGPHFGCREATACNTTVAAARLYAGPVANATFHTTQTQLLPTPPVNISKTVSDNQRLTVTSERPFKIAAFYKLEDSNGRTQTAQAYRARNRAASDGGSSQPNIPTDFDVDALVGGSSPGALSNSFDAAELDAYSLYAVSLTLSTAQRRLFSAPRLYRTDEKVPEKPPRVLAQRRTSLQATVTVLPPDPMNGVMQNYTLTVQQAEPLNAAASAAAPDAARHTCILPALEIGDGGTFRNRPLLLDGLDPQLRHDLTVVAANRAGSSVPSSTSRLRELTQLSVAAAEEELSSSALLGALLGGFFAGLITVWFITTRYCRGETKSSAREDLPELTDEIEQATRHRFGNAMASLASEGVLLQEIGLRRESVILRNELEKGAFGVLRKGLLKEAVRGFSPNDAVTVLCMDRSVPLALRAIVLAEARVLASLSCPHILPVIGVDLYGNPMLAVTKAAAEVCRVCVCVGGGGVMCCCASP
jgi:hypothetical protein